MSLRHHLTPSQQRALGSIRHGLEAKALQDDPRTVAAGRAHLPEAWRDDPPSEDKARKLLAFFKDEFFAWVNEPPCDGCGSKDGMRLAGVRGPETDEERSGLASRVEVYACGACGGRQTSFPRYNHPVKLMSSRRGRCGEWANCFCAMAVAAGFRTRFILDLTDHVWGEILSTDHQEQHRWIHCDPCENAFDAPLMYEAGWNKKLSWVFAFESGSTCKDVTRRYSRTWDAEMIGRRMEFHSQSLTRLLQHHAPAIELPSEREEFDRCVEATLPNKKRQNNNADELKPEEARGRISGSEAWRRARGELGDEKKEFEARYRALVNQGMSRAQAAVKAMEDMLAERKKLNDN